MSSAYSLLRRIGMRSTYSGYNYLAYAVTLAADNDSYLQKVTKILYVTVGEKYGVSSKCVESAIRTLINSYWNLYGDRILSRVLGYPLYDKPTTSELVSMLADFLRDTPGFK